MTFIAVMQADIIELEAVMAEPSKEEKKSKNKSKKKSRKNKINFNFLFSLFIPFFSIIPI